MKEMGTVILAVIIIIMYCFPTIQARNHKNFQYIWIVNLLLGWTILGWILAHKWATDDN
ncbi:hypothetical protein D3C87_1846400 [compost metagenome]